ncbi:MAG: type II secretion system protein N [Candidatus Babeliales bacterium]
MKHPFWLANSTLLILLIFIIFFIVFSRPTIPPRISFEPTEVRPPKKEISKIDVSKIYTNDLFNTYKQPLVPPKEPDLIKPMPQPPSPKFPTMPIAAPPKFLEPLKINLRGIIVATNEHMNIAIIEDVKEKKAKNYKVGETIEDGQLIRILKNKIILIRSNGQQETLYVSKHDAQIEQLLMPQDNWGSIIKKISANQFEINKDLFIERVRTLAQIIDMLNLTTVYSQGKSIGCRIGKLEKNSLGQALGLMQGDIIQKINDIPATNTPSRFEIYKIILKLNHNDTIVVELLRKNMPITMRYTLKKIQTEQASVKLPDKEVISLIDEKNQKQVEEEKRKIKTEQQRFAPTVRELEKKEKQDMLKMSQRTVSNRRHGRGILSSNIEQP